MFLRNIHIFYSYRPYLTLLALFYQLVFYVLESHNSPRHLYTPLRSSISKCHRINSTLVYMDFVAISWINSKLLHEEENSFTLRTECSGKRTRRVSKGSSEFKYPTCPIRECRPLDVGVYLYHQLNHLSSWIRVRSEGENRKCCSSTIHSWETRKQEDQNTVPQ